MNPTDKNLQSIMQRELQSREVMIWTGQPIPSRMMAASFLIYFFAIPWTAFSLFWTAMASGGWIKMVLDRDMPDEISMEMIFSGAFALFGLPFILIGLAMIAAPFTTYSAALKTLYVITNQRAVILNGGKNRTIKSFNLDKLGTSLEKIQKSDGSGHLYFKTEEYRDSDGDRRTRKTGFEHVENVTAVEKKFHEAMQILAREKQVAVSE